MTIRTSPIFYYGFEVTVDDVYINFDEGNGELAVKVRAGKYSFSGLATAIAFAMNSIGGQLYTVTTNRLERKYIISSVDNFDLLFSTGANAGLSIASVISFSGDKTGSNSYESDSSAGSEYRPPFPLQKFVSHEDSEELSDSRVTSSPGGVTEVYTAGVVNYTEFNIAYVTDLDVYQDLAPDTERVSALRAFMKFLISKSDIEMMLDENNKESYLTLLLETTPESKDGTRFKLKEYYSSKLIDFFQTGKLTFRVKDL